MTNLSPKTTGYLNRILFYKMKEYRQKENFLGCRNKNKIVCNVDIVCLRNSKNNARGSNAPNQKNTSHKYSTVLKINCAKPFPFQPEDFFEAQIIPCWCLKADKLILRNPHVNGSQIQRIL